MSSTSRAPKRNHLGDSTSRANKVCHLQTWSRLPGLIGSRDLATYQDLVSTFKFKHTEITMGTTFGMAARAGPEYLQPLLGRLHSHCCPRALGIVGRSIMSFAPELYLELLPFVANGKLEPMVLLSDCPVEAVSVTLEALMELWGSAMATALELERLLVSRWPEFRQPQAVCLLLNFVEALLPGSQLFQPLRFAKNFRIQPEFKILLEVYPEVSLESCVAGLDDPSLKALLMDHGRRLHCRLRPLMQRLCLDIISQGHPKMQTSLELGRLDRQARYSMLCWFAACWPEEESLNLNLNRLQLKYATLDATVAWFQRALVSSIRPWLLLMLGFADPVPQLDDRRAEHFARCVRYNAAYGTVDMIEYLMAQVEGNWDGALHCFLRSAIGYGRVEMMELGLTLKSDWPREWVSYFQDHATSNGRPELLSLLVG